MGKHATYQKRGSAAAQGFLTEILAADWLFTSPSVGNLRVTQNATIPAQAAGWTYRVRTPAGAWVQGAIQAGTIVTFSASSGVTYTGQVAWVNAAGNAISPWSDSKTQLVL